MSLQTGMDNIRNVIGCPVAGLTDDELFDASSVVRDFNNAFLRNKAFTNLPRKFNVAITGCTENCTHGETQDLSLTPAIKIIAGEEVKGFNIAVGGKIGSGGLRPRLAWRVLPPEEAASLCSHITLMFRDYGPRRARNRARLAFLVEEWGIDRFRSELERRLGGRLLPQGRDARTTRHHDHLGISRQKQSGLCAVGLNVPVGRITADQLSGLAHVARRYGTGDVRITTSQNVIVPNVAESALIGMTSEPLLRELRHDPSDICAACQLPASTTAIWRSSNEGAGAEDGSSARGTPRLGEEAADHALVRLSRRMRQPYGIRHWPARQERQDWRRDRGCGRRIRGRPVGTEREGRDEDSGGRAVQRPAARPRTGDPLYHQQARCQKHEKGRNRQCRSQSVTG